MTDTCLVQLGRIGDITNVLPIAARLHWALMVHRQYADVLEGCSIKAEYWDGSLEDPAGAAKQASRRYQRVIITQLFGYGSSRDRHCEHYCEDEWLRADCLEHFGKWPLVFDRRDAKREAELVKKFDDGRPMLLLSLNGISGPYRDAAWLREEITSRWGERFNIVDLGKLKLKYFFDLLGLYDHAAMLLTIDTATLHLAAASNVPAIELLSFEPEPWHGSTPKGNCILSMRYAETRQRVSEIHEAIGREFLVSFGI